MLALIYLILMYLLGDSICRRFLTYLSLQHRIAVSFLGGLLFSTVFTYLAALAFAWTDQPLIWADLLFGTATLAAIYLLRRRDPDSEPGDGFCQYLRSRLSKPKAELPFAVSFNSERRPAGDDLFDWLLIGFIFLAGVALMFATLGYWDDSFQLAIKSWSDFGPNVSLAQSFIFGHNFPTEHPFFSGEAIRYHFLFWFQAANLSFLGVNLVWSINILSALTLTALLMLVMTFAELVFNSRSVSRLSAILFFFATSSLSYIPFVFSHSSVTSTVNAILGLKDYVKSGFPYRGDDWGALGVAVYSNQRHLISAIGIMMIVLVFLIDLYRRRGAMPDPTVKSPEQPTKEKKDQKNRRESESLIKSEFSAETISYIFCGVLLGGLPYWNGAVYFAGALIVGGLLVLFPYRRQLLYLIVTAAVIGLPQLVMLGAGGTGQMGRRSVFSPGYIVTDPTFFKVIEYIIWTFGLKLVLVAVAMYFLPRAHRILFLIFSGLFVVVFLFQLSSDPFNNHKLLNIWNIFALSYSAYALWIIGRRGIAGRALAIILAVGMTFGAVIDLMPLRNDGVITVRYGNDELTRWLTLNTKPTDIFLSDRLLSHQILFTGHKLYLGDALYPTSAGHDILRRESDYRSLFQMRSPEALRDALQERKIAFVAVDDGLRSSKLVPNFNEAIFHDNFEKVFEDTDNSYRNLVIYKVPPR
jgi:hypothetical protein